MARYEASDGMIHFSIVWVGDGARFVRALAASLRHSGHELVQLELGDRAREMAFVSYSPRTNIVCEHVGVHTWDAIVDADYVAAYSDVVVVDLELGDESERIDDALAARSPILRRHDVGRALRQGHVIALAAEVYKPLFDHANMLWDHLVTVDQGNANVRLDIHRIRSLLADSSASEGAPTGKLARPRTGKKRKAAITSPYEPLTAQSPDSPIVGATTPHRTVDSLGLLN